MIDSCYDFDRRFNCLDNFMGYNRKFRNIIGEIWRIVLNKIRK